MFSPTTKEAANTTMKDAKNTAYQAKRDFQNQGEDASRDLSDMANQAGRNVRHALDVAQDQFSDAKGAMTNEIRNNPIRSTAIALGVGFVFGALLRR